LGFKQPDEGGTAMAFSDILGGFTKTYLYSNLARDAAKLWNRTVGEADFDFNKEALLRRVGLETRSPAKGLGMLLLGAAIGAVVGLALAPKPGSELRSEVKDRALNLFDQAKNKVQDVERVHA
jgi:hypothetical protein